MTQQVPELFDFVKASLAEARARARGPERFLIARMSEDLLDRLAPVLRSFDVALDLGTPLGAFAEGLAQLSAVGHAEHFPLDPRDARLSPARYALIVSGGLMHRVNDLPGLLIQIRRALKPDGLMIVGFPGGDTLTELREALMAAEIEIRGAAGLRVFPMIDVRAAGQLLQRAGFALPVADSEKVTVRYPNMFALVRDLRSMASTAAMLVRPGQPGLTRAIAFRAAEIYAERFSDTDGRIRATFETIWISGWAPHESQQRPLKPGSAKTRLADALREIKQSQER